MAPTAAYDLRTSSTPPSSTLGSSCPNSSTDSHLSRLTRTAAISPASYPHAAAPSRALLEEHTRIAWEVSRGGRGAYPTDEPPVTAADDGHLDLGMLPSSCQNVVFSVLIKLSSSIHETHAAITSLCTQRPAVPDDASFRSMAASAFQELRSLASIFHTSSITPHPDNLFVILSMFRPLTDLFSFAKERFLPLLEELEDVDHRIADDAERFDRTMMELSSTVRKTLDAANACFSFYACTQLSPGDGVQEITRYAMVYLKLLFEHGALLSIVLHVGGSGREASDAVIGRMVGTASLEQGIAAASISRLENMLEKVSKRYKVAALRWLFLVNNTHFILQQQEVVSMLGDGWALNLREKLEGYISRYLDDSWSPALSRLQMKTCISMIPAVCFMLKPPSLSRFYLKFEETYGNQKAWKVDDPLLRKRLREAVMELLLPAYLSYLENCRQKPPKFVKHTAEQLQELLSELFQG